MSLFRSFARFAQLAAVLFVPVLFVGSAKAVTLTATTTTLTVTANGSPVTTVAANTKVTLTATVQANGANVSPGIVVFCEVSVTATCGPLNTVATVPISSPGVASTNVAIASGTRKYQAFFQMTNTYAASQSATATVTGAASQTATLQSSGSAGAYSLTSMISGFPKPTGTVSFLDTSNANTSIGSGTLGTATSSLVAGNLQTVATGQATAWLEFGAAIADFNNDGILDEVVHTTTGTGVVIAYGAGDGTFPTTASLPGTFASVAIGFFCAGDFNHDGWVDVAIFSTTSFYVELNNGAGGGFTQVTTPITNNTSPGYSYNQGGGSMVAADINGDGYLDILSGDTQRDVLAMLGNGDGTFTVSNLTNVLTEHLAVVDVNGDGYPDIVLSVYTSGAQIKVALNKADGSGTFNSFTSSANLFTGVGYSFAAADYTGDGKVDLLVATNSTTLSLLPGNGDGTFGSATTITAPASTSYLVVADFNQDGIPDIAGLDAAAGSLAVYAMTGNGDGTFQSPGKISLSATSRSDVVVAGDVNGDGVPDLITPATVSTYIVTYRPTYTATATANNLSPIGSGTHQIEASFGSVVSSTVGLTAQPVAPSLSLVATPGSGQVTLKATLGPSTEQGKTTDGEAVTFSSGSGPLGSANLSSGVATLTTSISAGSYTFTAQYAGDTNFSSASGQANGTIAGTSTGNGTGGLLPNNNDPSASNWSNTGVGGVTTGVLAPDGTDTAVAVAMGGGSDDNLSVHTGTSAANNQLLSASIWLRLPDGAAAVPVNLFLIGFPAGGGFDIPSWQEVTVTSSWQRFPLYGLTSAALSDLAFQIGGANSLSGGQTLYLWTPNVTAVNAPGVAFDNFLLHSQQMTASSWGMGGGTVADNVAAAPDGTSSAATLTGSSGDASLGGHVGYASSLSSSQVTGSIWLRAHSGTPTVGLYLIGIDGNGVEFPEVGSATLSTTWQRFSLTGTTGANLSDLWLQVGGGNTIGSGQQIDVWGGQVQLGSPMAPYLATGGRPTFSATSYVNILPNATALVGSGWSTNSLSVTPDGDTGPDGTMTAAVLTSTGADGSVSEDVAAPALYDGGVVTGSVWLRSTTGTVNTSLYAIDVNASGLHFDAVVPVTLTTAWQKFTLPLGAALPNGMSRLFFQVGGGNSLPSGTQIEMFNLRVVQGAYQDPTTY